MPDGYRANLVSWCETAFPESYSADQLEHYTCIVREVQQSINGYSSSFTNAIQARWLGQPLYRPEVALEIYLDLLHGFDGTESLATKLLNTYMAAYDTCCCAVSPGKLLAWLAASPVEIQSEIIQANTILLGVCEDRAEMGDEPPSIDGYVSLGGWGRGKVFFLVEGKGRGVVKGVKKRGCKIFALIP